jgi:peptidoglycan/LPS O-acetylase OafA/YrhL
MVFWSHTRDQLGSRGFRPFVTASPKLFNPGVTGVMFFFVLSGFVLSWSHRDGDTPRSFYRRRFARIYPNLVALVTIAALLNRLHGVRVSWRLVAVTLLLLLAWFPREDIYFGFTAVAWTLSVEAFFYAVFPWAYRVLARTSTSRRRALLLVLIASIALRALAFTATPEGSTAFWLLYIFPVARLPEFLLGAVLAMELRSGSVPRVPLSGALAFGAISCLIAAEWQGMDILIAIPFALVIVAAAQRDLGGKPTIFSTRPLVALGAWSYAFYLLHTTVIDEVTRAAQHIHPGGSWVWGSSVGLAALVLAVAASFTLFSAVERPFERWLRPRGPDRVSAGVLPGHP